MRSGDGRARPAGGHGLTAAASAQRALAAALVSLNGERFLPLRPFGAERPGAAASPAGWPPPQHRAATRLRRVAALQNTTDPHSETLSQAKESRTLILPGLRPETEDIILSEVSQKAQKRKSDGFAEIHQFLWS